MVVYEALTTTTTATGSNATTHRILRALVTAGPRWLLVRLREKGRVWARGSNESASLLSPRNRSAALSLAAYCCFVAAAAVAAQRQQQQWPAAWVRSVRALGRQWWWRRLSSSDERTRRAAVASYGDNNDPEDDDDDSTITKHRGSCQCGAVQFQIKAPRTLHVQELGSAQEKKDGGDDDSVRIQYPRIAVPVEAFVLRKGRQQLQSFQRSAKSPAHTFCGVCGVHLLQAVDPSANELYVNALCLDRDTFVWKSAAAAAAAAAGVPPRHSLPSASGQKRDLRPENTKATKGKEKPQQEHGLSTNRSTSGSSPNFSSESDPEMVDLDRDPEFTLTAASSAFSDDNSSIDNDADAARASERNVLSPEKTGGPADNGGTNVDLFGSFMNVPAPSAGDNSDTKQASAAAADPSNLDTSFGSSSTASTTDAQKEQLRKFLGKHVSN